MSRNELRSLDDATVLVVGGSGFIGSRLVERLVCEYGARVTVLVRRVMSAATISRFPIEIVVGDVTRADDVARAARGCQIVFNCVKGKGGDPVLRRATDVDGATHVVEAAAAAKARVVHLSTMAVYDRPDAGDFDERSPAAKSGDSYTDVKYAGERAALAAGERRRVHVTVIQPTVVYGPNAGVYGRDILDEMQTHRLVLVNGGTGVCNAVYVDDAITGMLLAATADVAPGERFLISGPEYPTWQEFFGYFEQMLGATRTLPLSEADALALWRDTRRRPWLAAECVRIVRQDPVLRRRLLATREGAIVRALGRRLLSTDTRQRLRTPSSGRPRSTAELPVAAVRPWVVRNMARRARARIDHARNVLGYVPSVTLSDGMRLTGDWARWAGLVPDSVRG